MSSEKSLETFYAGAAAWLGDCRKRSSIRFPICTSLIVGVLIAWTPMRSEAQEQRCTELGANCACSEPMNSSEGGSPINDRHNFSDSPASSECNKYQDYFGSDGSHTMASVAGGNWGNARYALNQKNGPFVWLKAKSSFTSADRVVCYRYYQQVDDLYSSAGSNGGGCPGTNFRNKLFQMTFGSLSIQVQEQAEGICPVLGSHGPIGISIPTGPAEGNYYLSPRVDFNGCDQKPCRFEFCADGNIDAGTNIQFRLKVTSLENGAVGTATSPVANYGRPNLADFWGGDLFHSGPVGTSKTGFFIETVWQSDQNQWPGPAVEVEGTGGGGSTTPPLAPPVLLP